MKWYWIALILFAVVLGGVPGTVGLVKKIKDKAAANKAVAGA